MGIGTSIWAAPLDEVSIVPMNYQNKIFTNKEYVDLGHRAYKVNNEGNTVYLPLRLVAKFIENDEELWNVKWDKSKPDEVVLECMYMNTFGSARWYNGKSQIIKLKVGSQAFEKTFVDADGTKTKESGELSQAPKKFNGNVNLPLRAIGEVIGRQVQYKDGLVLVSDKGIQIEGDEDAKALQIIKKNLGASKEDRDNYVGMDASVNFNGINYYEVTKYDEKNESHTITIYSQKDQGKPQVIKTIKNTNGCEGIVDYAFYYIVEKGKGRVLEKFDLTTMQAQVVWQIPNNVDMSWISKFIPMGDTLYIATHKGDLTMGGETLYKIENGKSSELISCHQFGGLEISGDMIYYTSLENIIEFYNIGAYNQKTKKAVPIGTEGYAYDLEVDVSPSEEVGIGSYGIQGNIHINNDKLYILAYKVGSNEKQAVCSIDLNTNEQKKLTTPATHFWMNNNHIYYIEEATGFVKVVDLDGNGEKILVNVPVHNVELKNNCLYYTKKGTNSLIGEGLYIYGLTTGQTTTVSEKPIKQFKVSGKRIGYEVAGYAPSIYKWMDGKNTMLVEGIIRSIDIGEGSIGYRLEGEKENSFVKY